MSNSATFKMTHKGCQKKNKYILKHSLLKFKSKGVCFVHMCLQASANVAFKVFNNLSQAFHFLNNLPFSDRSIILESAFWFVSSGHDSQFKGDQMIIYQEISD